MNIDKAIEREKEIENEVGFAMAHSDARKAWINWIAASKVLDAAQKKPQSVKAQHATLKAFIADFSKDDEGYKREAVQEYFKQIHDATFRNRRQRTLELGKGSAKSKEFNDKRLCFGQQGFSMRYEYSTHARPYNSYEFAQLLKNPDELAEIVALLQNAKQHEIAMNVMQFAKLLGTQEIFGEGIVAQLEQPILIPHEFERYASRGNNSLPRIAERIELDTVDTDKVSFNLFAKQEHLDSPVQEAYAGGESELYEPKRYEVVLDFNKHVQTGDDALLQMQLWVQFEQVSASMRLASEDYKRKFAELKKQAEIHFGRYLLIDMVSK